MQKNKRITKRQNKNNLPKENKNILKVTKRSKTYETKI